MVFDFMVYETVECNEFVGCRYQVVGLITK